MYVLHLSHVAHLLFAFDLHREYITLLSRKIVGLPPGHFALDISPDIPPKTIPPDILACIGHLLSIDIDCIILAIEING